MTVKDSAVETGCALAPNVGTLVFFRALQGMASGAGAVVSRAVIRDMYAPADAQKMMSQVTLFFGIAPMIAPLIGGLLFVHVGWPAVFWFLAAVGAALWLPWLIVAGIVFVLAAVSGLVFEYYVGPEKH